MFDFVLNSIMCLTFTYCHLLAPSAVYAKRADPLQGLIFLMNEFVLAFTNCLAPTTFCKLSFLIFSIFFTIEDEDPFLSLQDQDFQVFADERESHSVSSDIKLGTRNFIASILFLWMSVVSWAPVLILFLQCFSPKDMKGNKN